MMALTGTFIPQPVINIRGLREVGSILTALLGLKDIGADLRGEAQFSVMGRSERAPLPLIKNQDIKLIDTLATTNPGLAEWLLFGLH